jgi:antitoxin HigA-1
MRRTLRHPSIEPAHPGAIIASGLDETDIKKGDLAKALGISRNTLYKLLAGRQGVTAEMAVRLGAVWGGSPEMWLNIQMDHDLWHAQKRVDTRKLRRLHEAA